jgi:hypothetical protein
VHASSPAGLRQGFEDIVDRPKLRGRSASNANPSILVHRWLGSDESWVIIVDSVEDPTALVLEAGPKQDTGIQKCLRRHQPTTLCDRILVSSRSEDAARPLVTIQRIVSVETLGEGSAASLL